MEEYQYAAPTVQEVAEITKEVYEQIPETYREYIADIKQVALPADAEEENELVESYKRYFRNEFSDMESYIETFLNDDEYREFQKDFSRLHDVIVSHINDIQNIEETTLHGLINKLEELRPYDMY